ncbi:MAG: S41 family peptidase [Muribaculaceae bacterium]|nr:S41 family peptidase [Muribaculaceae bacterium]
MKKILLISLLSLLSGACHEIEEWDNDPKGNFDALWTILDEHYCFFEEKGVDWNEVYNRYVAKISNGMTSEELFLVCAGMLDELKDGHVNLSSSFNTSYYRKWWSDYPQNYNERIVQEYYFNFNYRSTGGIDFGILPENIGYMHYGSFSDDIGEGNLDNVLAYFSTCNGLIIDVRDNGGGDLTNVETLVRRFITERSLAGYISHKTGKGHGEFSEPYAYYYEPADEGRVMWGKPVVVLTNRSTYSAANNFVAIMKLLPRVTVAGATTGGGSGMPFSSELPCGWTVRFSACSILDAMGNSTENGVDPTEGCAVDMDIEATLDGHDTILDFAIGYLTRS